MQSNLETVLAALQGELGKDNIVSGASLVNRNPGYCNESYDAGVLVLPRSTEEVSKVCQIANRLGCSIVAHGGLTGLVEATASVPGQICLSFQKMKQIEIDPEQSIAVVEPGVVLEELFEAAEPYGLMPGVDIPSRGSCTVGGLVSTNAGGVRVIRYGMMRENILGLEVVLASGEILDSTNRLVKNNAGYDTKQLFIGSEGTLGLITKIVLRLHPTPKSTATALLACRDLQDTMALLREARLQLDANLLSFEVMWPEYYQLTSSQPGLGAPPLNNGYSMYAVLEVAGRNSDDAVDSITSLLETAMEAGLVEDAVVASSQAQRDEIWRIRDDSDAIESTCEAYLSYDVGMQLRHMPEYVSRFRQNLATHDPQRLAYIFGHMGDGNLHIMFAVSQTELESRQVFDDIVYGTLSDFEGTTVSAEHGIGLEKKPYLRNSRSEVDVASMACIKSAMDPKGVLNPGKIF